MISWRDFFALAAGTKGSWAFGIGVGWNAFQVTLHAELGLFYLQAGWRNPRIDYTQGRGQ